MLWIRAVAFSVLVPGAIGGCIPWMMGRGVFASGFWKSGWLLMIAGAAIYLRCLVSFLQAHGTPAIFFTRHLRAVWGEEPRSLVRSGIYRYSRNPMYLAVVAAIFGQALLFASLPIAVYGALIFAFFHGIVTLVEEPHLRARGPEAFDEYRRTVARWL